MISGPDRTHSRRDTALFLLCLGLSIGALFAPRTWGNTTASLVRQTALKPLLWLQQRAEESKTSRAAFNKLRAERDSSAFAAQFLPALRAENDRLRALLGLGQQLRLRYVAAEVLHQAVPTDGRTLLLGVGSRDGVAPFDPVISAQGLVGVLQSVSRDRSVVMTWLHPEFRVSAFTEKGEVFGIVAPAAQMAGTEFLLQLRGVPYRDSIATGTVVVSSGLGGVYPQGIPVGTVIGPAPEETGWERVYMVRPAANPERVAQVLVLKLPHDSAAVPAFPRDATP